MSIVRKTIFRNTFVMFAMTKSLSTAVTIASDSDEPETLLESGYARDSGSGGRSEELADSVILTSEKQLETESSGTV
jgi:hypothetical protein